MPYIVVKLMEGRSDDTKERLVKDLTNVVEQTLQINDSHIRIELQELREGTFAIGGKMQKKKN